MFRSILIALLMFPLFAEAQDCASNSLQRELLQRKEIDQKARNELSASPQSEEVMSRALRIRPHEATCRARPTPPKGSLS